MKLDPDTFLLAAEILEPEGILLNGRYLEDCYACHAIVKANGTYPRVDNSREKGFFVRMFLDGDESAYSSDGLSLKFGVVGVDANREHRQMSLLLCWAMLSKP